MISIEQIDSLLQHSGSVMDQRGDRVGQVEQVFVGDESSQPEWVTVKTGLFGHSETFIPLREASMDGGDIRVPYEKNRIKDAPRTDGSSGHVEPEQEAELYRYYGLEPDWESGGESGVDSQGDRSDVDNQGDQRQRPDGPGQQETAGPPSDGAVAGTRGEPRNELRNDAPPDGGRGQHVKRDDTGSEVRNAEGVRLRKYTVTEHVTMTVPVDREHVEVVHEGDDAPSTIGKEDPTTDESHGQHPEHG